MDCILRAAFQPLEYAGTIAIEKLEASLFASVVSAWSDKAGEGQKKSRTVAVFVVKCSILLTVVFEGIFILHHLKIVA